MLFETVTDRVLNNTLTYAYLLHRSINLPLQRRFEIQLVQRVYRHDRMEQVSGVEAAAAHFLLAFQTQQDYFFTVGVAF